MKKRKKFNFNIFFPTFTLIIDGFEDKMSTKYRHLEKLDKRKHYATSVVKKFLINMLF